MKIDNLLQTKTSPYEMFKSNLTKDNSSTITYDNFADILSLSNKNTSNTENFIPSDNYTKYVKTIKTTEGAPYSYLADDWSGAMRYNDDKRILYIGDMKETNNVLTIPYSYLSDDWGVINHNKTIFYCNNEKRELYLGDMTKEDNILTIPLSGGGNLKVDRNSINDLAQSIDMFSQEDIKRILNALSLDSKSQKNKVQIEEDITETYMFLTGR